MITFPSFPKIRLDLPESYKKIYLEHLKNNRQGNTNSSWLTSRMEEWMHRQVASDIPFLGGAYSTLEIGAGTLNHLPFEKKGQPYDIIEPESYLYSDSPYKNRVSNTFSDIGEVQLNSKYERIISIATFEHICTLPEVVAQAVKLLAQKGTMRVAIPNEGSLFWRLGWRLTSALEFKLKYGLDYAVLMKYEHVNKASEIKEILQYFFNRVRVSYLGLSETLSFYIFFECKDQDIALADEYLESIQDG